MRGLLGEHKPSAFAIEFRPPTDQLFDIFCALGNERFHCVRIAKSGTGDERVALVKFGIVVVRQHDGNAALGIFCVGFAGLILCEDGDACARPCQLYRRTKTCNAASDDDKVSFEGH